MRTCSGKVYHLDKPNIDMNPNAFSSGITSPTYSLVPGILKTLEEIKAQVNTLGQRIDRIEVGHRGRDHNEDYQPK